MAVRLTKTSKIVFAIAIIVLSVVLGFLIWRVNQESTIAPIDSEAGGGGGACCGPAGCISGWRCDTSKPCNETLCVTGSCPATYKGATLSSTGTCVNPGYEGKTKCVYNNIAGTCVRETDPGGPTEGDCKDTKCEWPEVTMSGRNDATVPVCRCAPCTGRKAGDPWSCSGNPPTCNPGGCPSGYEDCGDSTNHEGGECRKMGSISCTVYHPDCNNPSVIYRYCKPIVVVENVCDGGSWVTKPSGNIAYENDITFSAKAKDSDGIDKASISVKRGTTNIPICTTGQTVGCITLAEAATETTISGTLSNASNRLQPGNYEITMSWKDKKGAASAACALSTTFTVLPQQTNPNWSITKGVVEQCIDAGTTNPKSELTYTITVKNTGNGAGTITKIEDVMDSKVQDSFVQTSSITSPGIYANKKITWTFSPALSIAAGATKTYTYKVVIDKDNFDTYANTVTLTPVGSSSIVATANITADCEIGEEPEQPGEVPQTGVFDTTISRIIAGFALVFFGVLIYNAPNGIFIMQKKAPNYKYRENFEKKVANK